MNVRIVTSIAFLCLKIAIMKGCAFDEIGCGRWNPFVVPTRVEGWTRRNCSLRRDGADA